MSAINEDIELIRLYLDGKLDGRAMFELERRAESDPVLHDLMQAMRSGDGDIHEQSLAEIDWLIEARVKKKRRRIVPWAYWAAAASLIAGTITIGWWMVNEQFSEPVYSEVAKHEEVRAAGSLSANRPGGGKLPVSAMAKPDVRIKKIYPEVATRADSTVIASLAESSPATRDTLSMNNLKSLDYAKQSARGQVADASARIRVSESPPATVSQALQGKITGVEMIRKRDKQANQLNEVSVASSKKPVDPIVPEPRNGWKSYREYLDKGARSGDGKEYHVTIEFMVNGDESLSDFHVLTGATETINKKAIELVRLGPKWIGKPGGNERVKLEIEFRP